MARQKRYDLMFNWATSRAQPFSEALERAARQARLTCGRVLPADVERLRRSIDQGRVRTDLFLNTQADGTNSESPAMRLCRGMKASGATVIEDPDDAHIYADRALQLDYLGRAGVLVPKYHVVEDWEPGKRLLSAAHQSSLGDAWLALPRVGLDRSRSLSSSARNIGKTLVRGGLRPGQAVILRKVHKPVTLQHGEARFRIWYLFGHILPCGWHRSTSRFELLGPGSVEDRYLGSLLTTTCTLARVTGLDWFMTELIVLNGRGKYNVMVVEPPNALAGLGPGVRALAAVPATVQRLAAQRLVELAWRRARRLQPTTGITVVFG